MVVPNNVLTDIPKPVRERFRKLLWEKAVLGYAFSYAKLHKLVAQLSDDEEEVREMIDACITGHNSKEIEIAKNEINDSVLEVMSTYGITSLDATDPFGRAKSYTYVENKGIPQFKRDKAITICSKYGVAPETMIHIIEDSTERTPFVTLMVRDKESKNGDKG